MATKDELLEEAKAKDLDVNSSNTKAEIKAALNSTEFDGASRVHNESTEPADYVNKDTNAREWSNEDQSSLEEELSTDNFSARVIQSVGDYVKVKWFRDNKPFVTFKSRKFTVEKAKAFLKSARDSYKV